MEEHEHHEHEQRHEHHSEHMHHGEHTHHKPTIKVWIIAAAIGLLIILSGIQAVELVGLNNKISDEAFSIGSGKGAASAGSSALNENLKNLPSMVGGC